MKNIIVALECCNRILQVDIFQINGPVVKELVTVLHKPLPVLAHFSLSSSDELVPVLPLLETFLGGFALHLRSFVLRGILFPSFPKFILWFPHITLLQLLEILSSGYISPEVMVTCLVALPNLEGLAFGLITTRKINPEDQTPLPNHIHIAQDGEAVQMLGTWIGNNAEDQAPWELTIDKVKEHLRKWNKIYPTMEGKSLIIQAFAGGLTQFTTQVQRMPPHIETAL
jgi:hypothetical protein